MSFEAILKGVLLVIFGLGNSAITFAEERVVASVGEWPPLIGKELKYYGAYCRIVSEAFALEGVKVEYVWVPWQRAYGGTKDGVYDISLGFIKNSEREREVNFSDPVIEKYYHVFYHLKTFSFKWQSYDDLKGIVIGATRGSKFGEEFLNAEKENRIQVHYANTDEVNFKHLISGDIQIFPSNNFTGYSVAKKSLTPEEFALLTNHPKRLSERSPFNYVVFSKNEKNTRMLQLFNRGLKRLKADGRVDQYLEESRRGDYELK